MKLINPFGEEKEKFDFSNLLKFLPQPFGIASQVIKQVPKIQTQAGKLLQQVNIPRVDIKPPIPQATFMPQKIRKPITDYLIGQGEESIKSLGRSLERAGTGKFATPGKKIEDIGNLLFLTPVGRGAKVLKKLSVPKQPQLAKSIKPLESIKQPVSSEEIISPVDKLVKAIKGAKPVRGQQETLYSAERGRRTARVAEVGQRIGGEKGFQAQLGQLKGELPRVKYEGIRGQLEQPDIDELFNSVERNKILLPLEKITAKQGLARLISKEGTGVPTKRELELLSDVFPKNFVDAILSKRGNLDKLISGGLEALNLPRTLMASFDLSAPLRQGLFFIGRKQWYGSFAKMFKQAFSEKAFQESQQQIFSRATYPLMRQHQLALTELALGKLSAREEAFMSNLGEKIPGIGKGIRFSNRGYVGFLNKLRADVFDDLYNKAPDNIKNNTEYLRSLTSYINSATGRGNLPSALEQAAPFFNAVFFSPRLMASRINLLNPQHYLSMQPQVRKAAIKDLFKVTGTMLTVLGLAKAGGAEVGIDPRSADFGKIKMGNTRWDILGGFQQYTRLLAQVLSGEVVSSTTGKVTKVGEGYKPMTKLDILGRFFEYKTSPVISFILTLLRGTTPLGEKISFTSADIEKNPLLQRFIPFVFQDMIDAYKEWGAEGPLISAPALFGVGSQTYAPRQKKRKLISPF